MLYTNGKIWMIYDVLSLVERKNERLRRHKTTNNVGKPNMCTAVTQQRKPKIFEKIQS